MNIKPLTSALGAEITGIDLAMPMAEDDWATVYKAWLDHLVLVFPGQHLTPEQQIAFARRFGPLDDHHEDPTYRLPGYPEIYQIGNFIHNGEMAKTKDTGRKWHSDHSYTTRPTLISMLYCKKIPPVGGSTMFSSTYMAYDTLSEKMKSMLEGLEVVHDFRNFLSPSFFWKPKVKDFSSIKERFPPVVHPLVRTHPETGKKVLYMSEGNMSSIVDLTDDESRCLLDFLFMHAKRPEFTYRHFYNVNDLVFWDNRCVQHYAAADYSHDANNPRHMFRLTVLGQRSGRLLEDLQTIEPLQTAAS